MCFQNMQRPETNTHPDTQLTVRTDMMVVPTVRAAHGQTKLVRILAPNRVRCYNVLEIAKA